MNLTVKISDAVLEISNMSIAELRDYTDYLKSKKLKAPDTQKESIVAAVASVSPAKKKIRRIRRSSENWEINDIEALARSLVEVYPHSSNPVRVVAEFLQQRPGNKRTLDTNKAMVYNVQRFLRDGVISTSIAKKTITDLESLGYHGRMLAKKDEATAPTTNMLGSVRSIPVQQA